jgi:anaerobic selenocysteine-containing dehydrogenase
MHTGRERFLVLALLAGIATTAGAQSNPPFQCTVNASVTPALRAESIAERTGDIVLNCSGGVPIDPAAIAHRRRIFRSF